VHGILVTFTGGDKVAGFLFKLRKCDGLLYLGGIGDGIHFTGLYASGRPAAKVADMRDVMVDFNGTDGAKIFTGTAQGTQRGRDFNTTEFCDGYGILRAFGTIMLLALMTDNRIINAKTFDFFNLNSGTKMSDSPRVKKSAVDFTSPAPRASAWINFQHESSVLSIL
jgi:hypothetical protein